MLKKELIEALGILQNQLKVHETMLANAIEDKMMTTKKIRDLEDQIELDSMGIEDMISQNESLEEAFERTQELLKLYKKANQLGFKLIKLKGGQDE